MTLVFTATHYGLSPGGSGESIRFTAEALAQAGQHVWISTPRWRETDYSATLGGVYVSRYPLRRLWPDGLPSEREFLRPSFHWRTFRAARRLARNVKAQVLHAQDRRVLLGTWLAARSLGLPCVLTLRDVGLLCPIAVCLHSRSTIPADCGQGKLWGECSGRFLRRRFWPFERASYGPRLRLAARYAWLAAERGIARRFDRICFVSEGLRVVYGWDGILLGSPAPAGRTVDECGQPGSRLPTVLYAGKPSDGKGWPDFGDAAMLLRRARPEVRIWQVGARPAGPLPDGVYAAGATTPSGVRELMRGVDLVVVPPRQQDALPRVALEALSLGVPVIGTRVGGLSELLPEGWLVPPCQPRALAERMGAVLADPASGRRLAREWWAEYAGRIWTPEESAVGHLVVYRRLT